jgi:hypothetical protein
VFVGAWFTLLALDTIEIHSTEEHLRALKMGGKWRIQRGESQTNKQTNETNNTSNDAVETY